MKFMTMIQSSVALILVLSLSTFSPALAQQIREHDAVVLKKSGKRLVGEIVSIDSAGKVRIRTLNGVEVAIEAADVESIERKQDAAQAYNTAASKLSKSDANGHLKLAEWCIDYSLYSQATEQLQLTVKADPKLTRAYVVGAQLEYEQLPKLETIAARELARNRLLGYIDKARAFEAVTADLELMAGETLFVSELPTVAAVSYRNALKLLAAASDASGVEAKVFRGRVGLIRCLLTTAKFAEAEAEAAKILETQPANFQGLLLSGHAMNGLQKFKEAEAQLTKAAEANPVVAESFEQRGIARFEQNNLNDAIVDFQEALKLGVPNKNAVNTNLGYCYLAQGKLKSAVNAFIATRGEQLFGPAELGLVAIKMRRGQFQAATDRLLALKSRIPRSGLALAMLAECEVEQAKLTEASQHFEEALRLGYDSRAGLRSLVDLAALRGKDDRALQWVQYLTANPETAAPSDLYRLGRLLLKSGRDDEAQEAFEAALKNEAGYIPAMNGLAFLAYKRGDYQTAKAYFEQVLKLNDTDLYAKRALRNIVQSETRKVWSDSFRRAGPEVTNSWETKVGFGIDVELRDNEVVFSGSQKTESFGKTLLTRKVDDGEFVRLEAQLDTVSANKARVGIRVTSRGGEAILFRDETGKKLMAGFRKTHNGKVELLEMGQWPNDTESHRLAIEIEDEKTGLVSFSIDDERRGECLVPALRRVRNIDCSVYGQAELQNPWTLKLKQVRVFVRKKVKTTKSNANKGGY